jgi:MoxR-like ATPase
VESIVASRFNEGQFNGKESLLSETISLFRYLRNHEQRLVRKPSLAEFLDWLRYLSKSKLDHTRLSERKDFLISMTTALLKNPGDQANIQQFILTWQEKQQGH